MAKKIKKAAKKVVKKVLDKTTIDESWDYKNTDFV